MDDFDKQMEQELGLLKNSIVASRDLVDRVTSVAFTKKETFNLNLIMKKLALIIPVAAVAVLVAVLVTRSPANAPVVSPVAQSSTNQPSNTVKTPSTVAYSGGTADDIVNGILVESTAEQSIANESDSDISMFTDSNTQLDSYANSYNPNEY